MPHLRMPQSGAPEDEFPGVAPGQFSGLWAAPRWLRDMGVSAWLAVGVTLFVIGVFWVLALAHTIVMPVIAASVIAAVLSPVVGWLKGHRIPRGAATALVLVGLLLLAAGIVILILTGITSQFDELRTQLASAKDTIAGWLNDIGVSRRSANNAVDDASSTVSAAVPALLTGVAAGLSKLSSLAFFMALTLLSMFFLLMDGPNIRRWTEQHMRVPPAVAHQMTGRVLQSMRGYFVGVTVVALFNAVVVGVGALIIGVPLAGTIALITFLGAYVPYLGAWTAGTFAVLISLGAEGTDAAVAMIVVQLLANGILQQMVQPIAMGAALGIHPLAVLIVTIGGGAVFGAVGLILAAPLVSAATRIASDMAQARAAVPEPASPAPQPEAAAVP
jgi:putative heme transporter